MEINTKVDIYQMLIHNLRLMNTQGKMLSFVKGYHFDASKNVRNPNDIYFLINSLKISKHESNAQHHTKIIHTKLASINFIFTNPFNMEHVYGMSYNAV